MVHVFYIRLKALLQNEALAFFTIAMVPFAFRAAWIGVLEYRHSGSLSGGLQTLSHDWWIFLGIVALSSLSFTQGLRQPPARLLRLAAMAALIVYAADIALILNFLTRLTFRDVLVYGKYSTAFAADVFTIKKAIFTVFALAILANACKVFVSSKRNYAFKSTMAPVVLCILLTPIISKPSEDEAGVFKYLHKNVIQYNVQITSLGREYSSTFAEMHYSDPDVGNDKFVFANSVAGSPRKDKKNIVVVVLESISSYHSKVFSGLNDWTPSLDAMAKANESYDNFFANGYNTNHAMIAILTGDLPLHSPGSYGLTPHVLNGGYDGFYGNAQGLPFVLKRAGYWTEYLTAGDTGFCDFSGWAKSIGFDRIEGREADFYKGRPVFSIKACADEDLYQRALGRVSELKPSSPYFLVLLTSSSHPPFNAPQVDHSEEGAVRYADAQLGHFYDRLRQSGFFTSGILLVLGDHRAMTPVTHAEIKKYGPLQAQARVPLVVVRWEESSRREQTPFQHVDVYQSLAGLASQAPPSTAWRGDFLASPKRPPRHIVHKRGDERNRLSVFSGAGEYTIELDGDDTRFLGVAPGDKQEAEMMLRKINGERIRRALPR